MMSLITESELNLSDNTFQINHFINMPSIRCYYLSIAQLLALINKLIQKLSLNDAREPLEILNSLKNLKTAPSTQKVLAKS